MKQYFDKQVITAWLDFLKKELGTTHSAAARQSGIEVVRLNGIKAGRTKLGAHDLKALALAYPILRDKAKALGINPNPSTQKELTHLDSDQESSLATAMLADIRAAIKNKDERILHLESEVARLYGIIDKLLSR